MGNGHAHVDPLNYCFTPMRDKKYDVHSEVTFTKDY